MPYAKPNDSQDNLFGSNEWWDEHWVGMPEFNQKNLLPLKQVTINFASYDDMRKFAEIIGQTITTQTRSVWYPPQDKANLKGLEYVDANLHRIKGQE